MFVISVIDCKPYLSFFPTEPTGYPPGIRIATLTPTSITYHWAQMNCFQQNGIIEGYRIRLYHLGIEINSTDIMGSTMTTFTAGPLTENLHSYSFSVAAFNQVGTGLFSPPRHAGQHDQCKYSSCTELGTLFAST